MKKLNRFVLGIVSTALLTAGLSRAADKLDPVCLDQQTSKRTVAPTPDSTNSCSLMDEHN